MKQLVLVTLVSAVLFSGLAVPALSDPDSLEVKVTPLVLSVNIDEETLDYGALALSSADDSRSSKASQELFVTNTGSVIADLLIQGSNATSTAGGSSNWALNCSPTDVGTVGANQYVHRFLTGASTDWAQGKALCPASSQPLASGVDALTGQVGFKLQMNMPTSSTGFGERISTVIVTAVQP